MNTLFLIVFLLSPILLVAGLVRPKILARILKSESRKRIMLIFGIMILVSFIGFGMTVDGSKLPKKESFDVLPESETTQTVELESKPEVDVLDNQEQELPELEKSAIDSSSVDTVGSESDLETNDLFRVSSVVDGDTIKVSIDGVTTTVRLIGMDTPETVDPRKPVQCFGVEASDKAKTTLSNQMVRLESDPTQGDTDKYQRLLRYVFLEDGTFFNKMMIEEGFAYEYTYDESYKYQTEFRAAQKAAQAAQTGLWNPNTCNGDTASTTPVTTTPLTTVETSQPEQSASQTTQPAGHTFYLSTYYTSKFYYCDTDEGWKSLSTKYLKSYPSEESLLKEYPTRILHEECE